MVQKINQQREPQLAISTGQLLATGLLEEVFHLLIAKYTKRNFEFRARAHKHLQNNLGFKPFTKLLQRFAEDFPAGIVYSKKTSLESYLKGISKGILNKYIVAEETLLLKLNNENPALEKLRFLFDDTQIAKETVYLQFIKQLENFSEAQTDVGLGKSLLKILRAPIQASPLSLIGQLKFIYNAYSSLLNDKRLMQSILTTMDILNEEIAARGNFVGGPPPMIVPDKNTLFGNNEDLNIDEYKRFSPDSSWMPSLVLIAKSVYVWLEQLSQKYQQHIHKLDHIPDSELDELAQYGFTGLWLIGIWERSPASQEIKRRMGNPEALASAYSIYDYEIATELGGKQAFENLHYRAEQRGIKLASDMVPNHMGIDSRWVIEHPERFLSLPEKPFPAYDFNSENLSKDARVTLKLEDHYYDHSDAAVVFQRVDNNTGETRYIYHGNDGTATPWNDTAQLNYLDKSVREAIIQEILQVARKFPIIRFDAAMTLTKHHIQRLWFPPPGKGGAIPSRAQYGNLSTSELNSYIPQEFWREVVDRVSAEVPDTLLLAEAFWLLEGYFVRTLGMHRVYNSAFMHMLKDEENAKYRQTIKNILESEPEILKRFVNFMSNPDEETAVVQFGKDDKYFGICTMMITLPGLPMFAHGQIEGFSERYGMEFRRANWQEQPDSWLVTRHKKEIFPLLHRRKQFAEVANFLLFDLFTPEGHVDNNVFAYTNNFAGQRSLFVFHNKYAPTRGWLHISTSYKLAQSPTQDSTQDSTQGSTQGSLAEALGIDSSQGNFIILKQLNGLESLYETEKLITKGFYLELKAYEYRVYLSFEQIHDDSAQNYQQLCNYLQGKNVPSITTELTRLKFAPVHNAYQKFVQLQWLEKLDQRLKFTDSDQKSLQLAFQNFIAVCKNYGYKPAITTKDFLEKLTEILTLVYFQHPSKALVQNVQKRLSYFKASHLLIWLSIGSLAKTAVESLELVAKLQLWSSISNVVTEEEILFIKLLTNYQNWLLDSYLAKPSESSGNKFATKLITVLLTDEKACYFLRINTYQGVRYFHKESFEALTAGLWAVWLLVSTTTENEILVATTQLAFEIVQEIEKAARASEYQIAKLENLLSSVNN